MTMYIVWYLLLCLRWGLINGESGHLFSVGSAALSWDSDELIRLRKLHERTFDDPRRFEAAPSLAAYLGLSPVKGIHLPIPVNVLLIGFNNDGKGSIQVQPTELQAWFSTLDHVLPHTRVPLSELTCKEDGYCVDFDEVRKPKPLHSYVHYNVSIHAVEVTSELSAKFAATIKALSRSQPGQTSEQLVDVTSLEAIIDAMLAEMGILWSYNILIINPDIQTEYTYRAGFSKEEIELLTKNAQTLTALKRASEEYRTHVQAIPGAGAVKQRWHPARKSEKFDVNYLQQESNRWAYQMNLWLAQRERLLKNLRSYTDGIEQLVSMKGIHADSQLSELIDILNKNEQHRVEMKTTGDMRVLEPEEGCPLEMWAGHRRWILMDLAAERQDWGPFVGGDGIKTRDTLPTINAYFPEKIPTETDKQTKKLKQELWTQREQQLEDLHAYRVEGYVPRSVMRETEHDLLQQFQEEYCNSVAEPPPLCSKVSDALSRLENDEDVFLSKTGKDLFMDWFGMDEDLTGDEMEHETRRKDLFLAHISAIVSRAIRHIFIPPTLTWKHQNIEDVDISTPYAKSVTFRLHLLTDLVRDNRVMRTPFDSERLKRELMGLKLERQDFHFTVQHTNIIDDAILSTSLSASLRSSTLEHFEGESRFRTEERLYFDSAELHRMLSMRLFSTDGDARGKSKSMDHLEVPIFVLILDRDRPVFIDRHYIAKALEDMVIVAHNSQYRGQHPLSITCGGGFIGQTLAAPLKATLAAVLQHLGGVLPPHLGYSPEHGAVAHDWTWSIGANPFSLTSPGWEISQAQKDALHRTYLLDSIDLSIEMVNHGIRLLESVSPSERSFEFVKAESQQLVILLKDFSLLVDFWRRSVNDAGNLDFDKAVARLAMIEETAERFLDAAREVEQGVQPLTCKDAPSAFLGFIWFTDEVLGIVIVISVGLILYKQFTGKRKRKNSKLM